MPLSHFSLTSDHMKVGAMLALATLLTIPTSASAQWFGWGRNRCDSCSAPPPAYAAAPASYAAADSCGCGVQSVSVAAAPMMQQTACVAAAPVVQQTACVAVQPVQQTVYQKVPVTKYRTVSRTERRPVNRTVYEDREVTVMQQVTEQRTVQQPYTTYQSITSYQPRTQDYSRWQTVYRPNCKVSPCEYDGRPGFGGWLNRTRKEFTNAFTPSRVATRQYVPDVRTAMVPVTTRVPITATRPVTYNVARMVPVKTKQRVAVLKQEYEDVPVTAMVPYTEMETVAVGTQVQMAYVSPGFGAAGMTAAAPQPTRAASNDQQQVPRKASNSNGTSKLQSYAPSESQQGQPRVDDRFSADGRFQLPENPTPRAEPHLNVRRGEARTRSTDEPKYRTRDPRLVGFKVRSSTVAQVDGWNTGRSPLVLRVADWKPVRPDQSGPRLDVVMNNDGRTRATQN